MPPAPNGQSAPTAKKRLATATPSAPESGSRATMDQVIHAPSACPDGTRWRGQERLRQTRGGRAQSRPRSAAPDASFGLPQRVEHVAHARDRMRAQSLDGPAARLVRLGNDRRRESELRRFAQAVLASLHGPDLAREADLAEYDELRRQRTIAHRRENR